VSVTKGADGKNENRRKSVGERIQEIECLNIASTVKATGVADRLPSLKKGNGVADMLPTKITWSEDDENAVRKLSKSLVHKKWETLKICLHFIEENKEIVRRLSPKEKKKEMLAWNDEDERNVTMFMVRNVRYLNPKNARMNGANKENVLEQFCRNKGLHEQKEKWRKVIETEIDFKEIEVEEIKRKTKQAKSKKKKNRNVQGV
jgi:hypothetical protein